MRNMLVLKIIFFTVIYTVASLPEEVDYQIEDYDSSVKEELYENESAETTEDLPGDGTERISDVPSTVFSNLTTEDPIEAQTITTVFTTSNSNDDKNIECPEYHTAYVKNDLEMIINEVAIDLKLNDSLKTSYYEEAVKIRNKFTDRLNKFRSRLEHRPEHLKHVLMDLGKTREATFRMLSKTQSKLQNYNNYKDKATSAISKANKLLKTLEQYKILCSFCTSSFRKAQLNSRDWITWRKSTQLLQQNSTQIVHCNTYDKLVDYISTALKSFEVAYQKHLIQRLNYENEQFDQKITIMMDRLKEMAIQQFGVTIYDILSLQDDYFHIKETLTQFGEYIETNELNNVILLISNMSTVLEKEVPNYGKRCQKCLDVDNVIYKRMNVDKSQALLEEVLNASLNTIISIINMDYESIFKDLNDTLNNPHYNDEILDALIPIQNDIAIEINKEKNFFIEIHERVPKINDELAVVVKTKDIMKKIQEAVEFLTTIPS